MTGDRHQNRRQPIISGENRKIIWHVIKHNMIDYGWYQDSM